LVEIGAAQLQKLLDKNKAKLYHLSINGTAAICRAAQSGKSK